MSYKVICVTAAMLVCASVGLCDSTAEQCAKAETWLKQFGYLPPSDQPYSGEKMEVAIRHMQKFGGLPETGELDPATLAQMSKPRCALPDVETGDQLHTSRMRRYTDSGRKWSKKSVTWSLENYPNSSRSPSLSKKLVQRILRFAVKAWSSVSSLKIKRRSSSSKKPRDILVSFGRRNHGDNYPFDGEGKVLAHAFYPGSSSISGDVHFDDDESWSKGKAAEKDGSIDLFFVAVHEFGHSLGLGHSNVREAVMYPFYPGPILNFRKYKLPADDRAGIQAIYGPPSGLAAAPIEILPETDSKETLE